MPRGTCRPQMFSQASAGSALVYPTCCYCCNLRQPALSHMLHAPRLPTAAASPAGRAAPSCWVRNSRCAPSGCHTVVPPGEQQPVCAKKPRRRCASTTF
eukprot:363593-Chlamydomonas_euryale.AAC.4